VGNSHGKSAAPGFFGHWLVWSVSLLFAFFSKFLEVSAGSVVRSRGSWSFLFFLFPVDVGLGCRFICFVWSV